MENIGSIKTVVPGFGGYIFISHRLRHQRTDAALTTPTAASGGIINTGDQ